MDLTRGIHQAVERLRSAWARGVPSIEHIATREPLYTVFDLPAREFRVLLNRYLIGLYVERNTQVEAPIDVVRTTMRQPCYVQARGLGSDVFDAIHRSDMLLSEVQRFAGCAVDPTVWYGPRIYLCGARLGMHVDHPGSHALGVTVCLERRLEVPWPLVFEGPYRQVLHDLLPGQALVYWGADVRHGRPSPLRGERYAGVFFHYRLRPSCRNGRDRTASPHRDRHGCDD